MVEPGKNPTRGSAITAWRNDEAFGEIRHQRMHLEMRKVAAQLRGVLLQEFAGNIDRHIGLDRRRGAEQDARLFARAGAEFDQARSSAGTASRSPARARVTAPISQRVG